MGDAFFGSAWHTMLVGGLNAGGQEIYALDITNPSSFASAQTSPSTILKWEFTDANDADLGFTYSQPQIVRLHNGKWAAVFGNGYNNSVTGPNDAIGSTTGKAALFIVDIQDGSLIRKISLTGSAATTGDTTNPNGLATPAMVDIDGDRIVDFAFAGDLYGNMWKFDLRSATPSSWNSAFSGGGNPLPLYVAKDNAGTPNRQPITERPVVIRGPSGAGMSVLFGTGKYLETGDNSSTAVNTFYGIYDRNSSPIVDTDRVSDRSVLQQQTITNELSIDFDGAGAGGGPLEAVDLRVTSNNAVDTTTKRGWYMDLTSPVSGAQGEKSVSNPLVRNGHLIFTTLIPSSDPCSDGGTSWLMELDALSGKRLTESPFDLNGDGIFSEADYVTLPDGTKVPAGGLKSTEGILPTPGVLSSKDKEFKYTPGTSGEIQVTVENPGKSGTGRQSWRQVR
jgi:type IV pilus assembly protein PilY1